MRYSIQGNNVQGKYGNEEYLIVQLMHKNTFGRNEGPDPERRSGKFGQDVT